MRNYVELINNAHAAATAAMDKAITAYRAEVKARGDEAWARAANACGGEHAIEPMYCGFAWVIIPAKQNPELMKALRIAKALTAGRDMGDRAGYVKKGVHTASDWYFHGPGQYRGQSMDIKEIGALAFVEHLTANGVVGAFSQTRAD
jgi:hypothetical protein